MIAIGLAPNASLSSWSDKRRADTQERKALVQMKDLGSRAASYGPSQSIQPWREERLVKG
ncbi:hypothetical protein XI01_03115 [Bradyrhizobium sp. CCBAU 21360]|nr:hypothetical protein [Bradyrhizobium sp. CCBAU 21360]